MSSASCRARIAVAPEASFGPAKARRRFLRFSFGGLILWAYVVVKFHGGAEDISERQFKRGADALNCAKFWHSLVILDFP